jgi:AcrR family transcriptional regulator
MFSGMLDRVSEAAASVDSGEPSAGILDGVVAAEMGDEMAGAVRRLHQAEEARYREQHPQEGLRERKRRLTRKLISDAATTLFASRGFDAVRVSEIADRVGVSEKTIYNYFPTKESMVLDEADELVEDLAAALRERPAGLSVTGAVLAALEAETMSAPFVDDELAKMVPRLVAMIEQTPALHAHWLQVNDRLARVAAEELAIQAGTAPRDPEAVVASRALVGLVEVNMESSVRHIVAGLRGADLREAVLFDIRRAARLLDTGLSSLARDAQTGGRSGSG